MSFRRSRDDEEARGFGGFLRSLLAGVPWSEKAEGEEVLHLEAPSRSCLRVHNANGRTRLVGEDRSDIEVRAAKTARAESTEAARALLEGIRLIHERSGNGLSLEVDVPRKWNRRGHVNLEIAVPSGIAAEIHASNGKVSIESLRAAVRARSSNGSIMLSDVVGDVEIVTSNATICCSGTRGRLMARSSNGKIQLEDHCGSVDASTSNGLIRAQLDEIGEEGVQLATSNGRILLELPEKVDAELDIRVDNGIIRNERDLERDSRERSGQLRGRLGKGGALIKLRTSNGSVNLR